MDARGDEPTDEALAAAARDGDESALQEIFRRHEGPLQALMLRRIPPAIRRKVSVADVLQETYAAVWTSLEGFQDRGPGSLRAWLGRIAEFKAKNAVRDLLRDRRDVRREVPPKGSGVREYVREKPDSPSAHAIARELDERLRSAIGRLKPDQRIVLSLVLVEGLSMAEAGERMGRSANAAQKLYRRAKDRLWDDCAAEDPSAP